MPISFDSIPSPLRVPIVVAEFNSSRAQQGPALLAYRAILIGQKLAAGAAAADSVVRVTSVDQAIAAAGRGSMLHRQSLAWFASNAKTELWLGVLADNGAGVAATGTIVVTGPATASGTISLYLGGERLTIGVTGGDSATTIATAIAAAVTAAVDLPVTASVAAATVTLTCRHKGLVGNTYDVRHSYRDGESLPAGVALAITAMGGVVAGTANPSLANLIAAMGDIWFHVWAHPYTDATSLSAIEAEMLLRFGPLRSMDGLAITSASGSFSSLTTLGASRNSQHSVIASQTGASPLTPPMEFAAEVAAVVAFHGAIDPARPFQTLALARALPTAQTDQWSNDERDQLLRSGISTTVRTDGGAVQLNRIITTYRTSPSGSPDTSYLDATTILTLMYLRYSWRVLMATKYPRHKLADDGTRVGSGQAVMTPALCKAEALGWFRDMEKLGLVEGFDQFKRDLVVERDVADRNRINVLLPPDLINQLIVVAAQFQFRI
jgi:phage tail sheath gpL-like